MDLNQKNFVPSNDVAEGNVFGCVLLSTGGWQSHVTITHDALNLTVQGP